MSSGGQRHSGYCEHDQIKRKCEICALNAQLAAMTAERDLYAGECRRALKAVGLVHAGETEPRDDDLDMTASEVEGIMEDYSATAASLREFTGASMHESLCALATMARNLAFDVTDGNGDTMPALAALMLDKSERLATWRAWGRRIARVADELREEAEAVPPGSILHARLCRAIEAFDAVKGGW